jgi:hypothetical protein
MRLTYRYHISLAYILSPDYHVYSCYDPWNVYKDYKIVIISKHNLHKLYD